MEYGKLMSRSANLVWQNKFLILVAFLAALGSGLNGGGGGGSASSSGNGSGQPIDDEVVGLIIGAAFAVFCVILLISIVIWVVSSIARGGLIASVDAIESGEKSSFRQAWSAGWQKIWTLLGIGLLPAIPALVLFLTGLLALGAYGGLFALFGSDLDPLAGVTGIGTIIAVVACCMVPLMLVLSVLRNFAERACMLEDLGVVDSYRRGTNVLMSNLGEAIILALLQIGLFIVLGLLLFLPGLVLVLCFCLWPLLLVIQGFVEAFVSALWTLAWRHWTGEPPLVVEKAPEAV